MRLEVQKPHVVVNWINDWVELEAFENPNDQNALQINIVLSDAQGHSIWYELNKKYGKVKEPLKK